MASILPFDELNRFNEDIRARFGDARLEDRREEEEDIIDELLDLFLLAYAMGNSVTNDNLSSDYAPSVDEVMKVVDAKVAGKTWRERVEEYFTKASNGEIPVSKLTEVTESTETTSTTTTQPPRASGESSGQRGQTGTEEPVTPSGGISLQEAITRIAETETHRIANTAALDTAKYAGAKSKTWVTMLDDKVRDTHDYLEGETVNIDEDFYTYDGDHASAPGLFELAENNVNCRCELLFS